MVEEKLKEVAERLVDQGLRYFDLGCTFVLGLACFRGSAFFFLLPAPARHEWMPEPPAEVPTDCEGTRWKPQSAKSPVTHEHPEMPVKGWCSRPQQ